jgi:hypothetical protein
VDDAGVDHDVIVDGVDVSSTAVDDERGRSVDLRSGGGVHVRGAVDVDEGDRRRAADVEDKGGAHVHGAVDDHVYVNVHVDLDVNLICNRSRALR